MPGVIVPRKTVGELRKLIDETEEPIEVALSDTRIRFAFDAVILTSKLIDGTFPDYQRVIPTGNDKILEVDRKQLRRGRRPRLHHLQREIAGGEAEPEEGQLTLSATSPENGSASEELEVNYGGNPIEIGFNSRYLLDITEQIEGERRAVRLADAASPTLVRDAGGRLGALCADADAGVMAQSRPEPNILAFPAASRVSLPGRAQRIPCEASRQLAHPLGALVRPYVARLMLSDFRCYERAALETDPRPVVLTGPNGAGKTNLLEAISFLAPGRGLRQARLAEVDRRRPSPADAVAGEARPGPWPPGSADRPGNRARHRARSRRRRGQPRPPAGADRRRACRGQTAWPSGWRCSG